MKKFDRECREIVEKMAAAIIDKYSTEEESEDDFSEKESLKDCHHRNWGALYVVIDLPP